MPMPELPEVETIRIGLQEHLVGQVINSVEILHPKTVQAPKALVEAHVVGVKISSLQRRAKLLFIHLNNGYSLVFHLKMTGQMVLIRKLGQRYAGGHPTRSMAEVLPDKSTKVIFTFGNGDTLYFNDQRVFGWVKLMLTIEIDNDSLVKRLGPEPLTDAFSLKEFAAILKRRKGSSIKAVLLDQSAVSGIGNIYADESLHLAKIHPAKLAVNVTEAEAKRLHTAIKEIIALGIKYGGTSFSHYVTPLGGTGDYFERARVFRKQGQICSVCGSEIVKIRVTGRGTHLCPTCQPSPKTESVKL